MSDSARKASPRATRFWDRMLQWYGVKFTDTYGKTVSADWAAVVDRADDESMMRAMSAVRSKYIEWPPTLPQFEVALKPPAEPNKQEKSIQTQLREFVCRSYTLTMRQMYLPWTDICDRKPWQSECNVIGVIVPADGDAQGYRVMVADMQAQVRA